MKTPILLVLTLALAFFFGSASAQSIVRVSPDTLFQNSPNRTVTITVRGLDMTTTPVEFLDFHYPACQNLWNWQRDAPWGRGGQLSNFTIVNDSTVTADFNHAAEAHLTSTYDLDMKVGGNRMRKDAAIVSYNPQYPAATFTVTPIQDAQMGQTLEVVASGGINPFTAASGTIHVDFNQSSPTVGFLSSAPYGAGTVAKIQVPSFNITPGCYDVIIRKGNEPCQTLQNKFCVGSTHYPAPYQIKGRVYLDNDRNCAYRTGDTTLKNIVVAAYNNTTTNQFYAYTDSLGNYTMDVDYGNHTVNLRLNNIYTSSCNPDQYVQTQSVYPYYPIPAIANFGIRNTRIYDWAASLIMGRMRPGFNGSGIFSVNNNGLGQLGGTAYLLLHDSIRFVSSSPAPTAIHGDTLIYTISDIPGQGKRTIQFTYSVPINFSLVGQILTSCAWVAPDMPDSYPLDNQSCHSPRVTNSYDPNDKAVQPAGQFLQTDSVLSYRIRFQNTGTDTAYTVVVRDTLSDKLDATTIRTLGTTHPYTLKMQGNKVAEWYFQDIMLVDSNHNEPASHGAIHFSIKRKKGLPMGTRIDNRAGIYFDFNPPVMTNYASTTLSSPVKVREAVGTNGVTVYPNPMGRGQSILRVGGKADLEGADFQLLDVTGRRVATSAIRQGAAALERSRLKAGLYTFRIIQKGKPASTGRLVLE